LRDRDIITEPNSVHAEKEQAEQRTSIAAGCCVSSASALSVAVAGAAATAAAMALSDPYTHERATKANERRVAVAAVAATLFKVRPGARRRSIADQILRSLDPWVEMDMVVIVFARSSSRSVCASAFRTSR